MTVLPSGSAKLPRPRCAIVRHPRWWESRTYHPGPWRLSRRPSSGRFLKLGAAAITSHTVRRPPECSRRLSLQRLVNARARRWGSLGSARWRGAVVRGVAVRTARRKVEVRVIPHWGGARPVRLVPLVMILVVADHEQIAAVERE
jgi:hypothetical protein